MISTLLSDFSRVWLFPKDKNYLGGLNELYDKLKKQGKFNFFDYFELNEELLTKVKDWNQKLEIYIFTTGHIQNTPGVIERVKPLVKGIYSAEDLPINKLSPEGFVYMAQLIGKKSEEILYIDDKAANLERAQQAGTAICLYTENKLLFQHIDNLSNQSKSA